MKKIDIFDLEELACKLLGMNCDAWNDRGGDYTELENAMIRKYDIYWGDFERLANDLIKLTYPVKSEISGKVYQCFGTMEDGSFSPIAQVPYKE